MSCCLNRKKSITMHCNMNVEIFAVLGILHSMDWRLFTDVSGQPIGPSSRVKQSQKTIVLSVFFYVYETWSFSVIKEKFFEVILM